jgi:hypothetical protein
MNLPMQSPPVLRGQDRRAQAHSSNAASPGVAQSDLLGTACAACSLLPSPWNTICQAICKAHGH